MAVWHEDDLGAVQNSHQEDRRKERRRGTVAHDRREPAVEGDDVGSDDLRRALQFEARAIAAERALDEARDRQLAELKDEVAGLREAHGRLRWQWAYALGAAAAISAVVAIVVPLVVRMVP